MGGGEGSFSQLPSDKNWKLRFSENKPRGGISVYTYQAPPPAPTPKPTGRSFLTYLIKSVDVESQQHRRFEGDLIFRWSNYGWQRGPFKSLSHQLEWLPRASRTPAPRWPSGPRKLGAPPSLPNQTPVLSLPCDREGALGPLCPWLHRADEAAHKDREQTAVLAWVSESLAFQGCPRCSPYYIIDWPGGEFFLLIPPSRDGWKMISNPFTWKSPKRTHRSCGRSVMFSVALQMCSWVCFSSTVLVFIFPKWFISIFPVGEGYH